MHSLLKLLYLNADNSSFQMTVECRYCRIRSRQDCQSRKHACRCRNGLVQVPVDSLDMVLSHRVQQWARE